MASTQKEQKPATEAAAVHCTFDKMVALELVVPNPKNPNQHSSAQIDLLAGIIRHRGWRNSIQVSNQSGFIVSGHCRLEAARKLGLPDVPVDYQDFESEADEWAHMIADNRIAELATIDNAQLSSLLAELETSGGELETTGFTRKEMDELAKALEPMEYNTDGIWEGNLQDNDEMFENEYANTSIRQIVLVYDEADYESICADLDKIKDDQNLKTNTDAVTYAVRKAGEI